MAVKMNICLRNPLIDISLPKNKKIKKLKVLNREQQKILVDNCTSKNYIFLLILGTGLRLGEALALKWSDVDFDNNKLLVQNTLIKVNGKIISKDGGYQLVIITI